MSRTRERQNGCVDHPASVCYFGGAYEEPRMLTGYNQDVITGGETLHVQTEDKGRAKAIVETLVYRGGTIIAAKRTSYADQMAAGTLKENDLAEMLKKQHQIIVAILKAGKVEELVRASQRAAVKDNETESPAAQPFEPVQHQATAGHFQQEHGHFAKPLDTGYDEAPPPPPTPAPVPEPIPVPDPVIAKVPDVQSPDLDAAGRAVIQRVTGPLTGELDLDKIISDYLQSGLQKERLRLRLLSRSDFLAGDTIFLQVQASRGTGQPIENASVVVKVIGTAFKPQIFPGRTDREGIASFSITLPTFSAGSAAVVVQASSKYGDGEIKHLIRRR